MNILILKNAHEYIKELNNIFAQVYSYYLNLEFQKVTFLIVIT